LPSFESLGDLAMSCRIGTGVPPATGTRQSHVVSPRSFKYATSRPRAVQPPSIEPPGSRATTCAFPPSASITTSSALLSASSRT